MCIVKIKYYFITISSGDDAYMLTGVYYFTSVRVCHIKEL
jgi:hypothetical protein